MEQILQLALTLGKVALLVVLMFVGGARLVPWLLVQVSRTGSRELFTLAVLAVALGIAYGGFAALFYPRAWDQRGRMSALNR